ncbi:hypothetical protein D3C80_838250 [compost metagenome]
MGGVIIPSAKRAQPPIMAGTTSHFALRLTNEKSEKIPPSPLLSACNVTITYLSVVCNVNVQKTQEIPPNTKTSLIALPSIMALKT